MSGLEVSALIQRDDFELRVDLQAEPGETIGLAGGIGAGKSTVIQLLRGRLTASSGHVSFDGTVWDDPSSSVLVDESDRAVTAMSQHFRDDLPEDQTGIEIVRRAVARFGGAGSPEDVLAELGVEDHVIERLPWTFSGAEAQRIALAAAVAPRPPLLLLDEPFGALDLRSRPIVRSWLADQLATHEGVAVVASTDEDDLAVLADRIHSLD